MAVGADSKGINPMNLREWWGRLKWVAWVTYDRIKSTTASVWKYIANSNWDIGLSKWGSSLATRLKKMPITWIVIGLLFAGNVVTYGAMLVREKIVVAGAVTAEKTKQVQVCNVRVNEVTAALNRAADDRVAAAEEAAGTVLDPETDTELMAICQREASCRDRRVN